MDKNFNFNFHSVLRTWVPGMLQKPHTVSKGYRDEWVIHVPLYSIDVISAWCEEVFGKGGRSRQYRWRRGYVTSRNSNTYKIFLRNENDVLLFRLKWM